MDYCKVTCIFIYFFCFKSLFGSWNLQIGSLGWWNITWLEAYIVCLLLICKYRHLKWNFYDWFLFAAKMWCFCDFDKNNDKKMSLCCKDVTKICYLCSQNEQTMKESESLYNIYRYKMQPSVSSPLLSEQLFPMNGRSACFFRFSLLSLLSPRQHCFSCVSGGFFLSSTEVNNRLNEPIWNR